MASAPDITAVIKTDLSWLQRHERIIIVALVLAFGTFGLSKYFNHAAAVDSAKAATAQAILQQQITTGNQLAQQTAAQVAQYQAMVQQLTQQNQALLTAIQNDNAVLKQRQADDKTLPLPAVAQRWEALVPSTTVTATPTGVSLDTDSARNTVVQLEQVPVLTDELSKETSIVGNVQTELNSCQAVTTDQIKQIAGLNTQITDTVKADQAELKAVKAQGRKSKLKWFFAGLITGFFGRGAI